MYDMKWPILLPENVTGHRMNELSILSLYTFSEMFLCQIRVLKSFIRITILFQKSEQILHINLMYSVL